MTRALKFENAPYHHSNSRGRKAASPTNGQRVYENSVPLNESTTPRRIGVDPETGEIVVFDDTNFQGKAHGHVRRWEELTPKMQSVLRKAGLVNAKGKIVGEPK